MANGLLSSFKTKVKNMSREASARPIKGLVISAPEWFERDDFCEWIKSRQTATWYEGGSLDEVCDAFTVFDHGSGPDVEALPASIWSEICELADEHGLVYGIIWINPV